MNSAGTSPTWSSTRRHTAKVLTSGRRLPVEWGEAEASRPHPRVLYEVGLFSGDPLSPTKTLSTIQWSGVSKGSMLALVTSSDCPRKARPQGDTKRGLEIRLVSLPAASRTATWFG